MVANKRKIMRRKFWVSTEIQGRFIVFYVLACAVLSVLMVCFVFASVWSQLSEVVSISKTLDPMKVFSAVFLRALATAGVLFALSLAGGCLLLVFLTHRVAGPVHRIQKLLESTEVSTSGGLRRGDALQDVYQKLCSLLERNIELSEHRDNMVQAIEDLCEQQSRGEAPSEESWEVVMRLAELASKDSEEDDSVPEAPES